MASLFIKNMVCNRCIMVVRQTLNELSIKYNDIKLGEVVLEDIINDEKKSELSKSLLDLGFEIIDDRKTQIIEKIKSKIINLIYYKNNSSKFNLSVILSSELYRDYNSLSNLFSEVEGTTIEKYFIAQKIERVKELLEYNELSLSEIALRLNYSSVSHLSYQFKQVTGLTPTNFKKIGKNKRKPIDKV